MFTVTVPELVLRQSNEICRQTNFGMRAGDTNGTKEQQLNGIIAQNAIALAFGFPFVSVFDMWDGGYDFTINGVKFDVKTVGRTVPPKLEYEATVLMEQIRYDCQGYLFTSYDTFRNQLTVCGWLTKDLFLERARVYRRGDVIDRGNGTQFTCRLNSYQVYYYQLHHLAQSFDELKDDLDIYTILS